MHTAEYKMIAYSGILSLFDINLNCRRKPFIERIYSNTHDYTHIGLCKSLVQKRGMFEFNHSL